MGRGADSKRGVTPSMGQFPGKWKNWDSLAQSGFALLPVLSQCPDPAPPEKVQGTPPLPSLLACTSCSWTLRGELRGDRAG